MNNSRYICPICILLAFLSPACERIPAQQDPDIPTSFTAIIEDTPFTKTILSGTAAGKNPRNVYWESGDQIAAAGGLYTLGDGAGTNTALFTGNGVLPRKEDGVYKAYYPASFRNNGEPRLPSVQVYNGTDGSGRPVIGHLPMYAQSSDKTLLFHNLCSVLSFQITGSHKVDSVVVESTKGSALSGKIQSMGSSGEMVMDGSDVSSRVKLDCSAGGGVLLSGTPTEFLVGIPPGAYAQGDLSVTVYSGADILTTLSQQSDQTYLRSYIYPFGMEIVTKSMELEIKIDDITGKTIALPFYNSGNSGVEFFLQDVIIDWGDTNIQVYPKGTRYLHNESDYTVFDIRHTYTNNGNYTITITSTYRATKGCLPELNFYNADNGTRRSLKKILTPLLPVETTIDSNGREYAHVDFSRCENLEEVCSDLFINNGHLTSVDGLFDECINLKSIPGGLFEHTPNLTSMRNVFSESGLSGEIPANLFANNTKVEDFYGVFYGCKDLTGEIPADLFANNPLVEDFSHVFGYCSGLTGGIPANLFANNPEVTSFYCAFNSCSGLTGSIPEDLFASNKKVDDFRWLFSGCSGLTGEIPANLFKNNTAAKYFAQTFSDCSGLTSIHPDLFAYNHLAENFAYTFEGCTKISSIPSGLFDNNPGVLYFGHTFENCTGLTSVPSGLFANKPNATDYTRTFSSCTSLTGPLPGDLFANNPKATTFEHTFYYCTSLDGIPASLFAGAPAATSFRSCFHYCRSLTMIPAGLFDQTKKVTTFLSTFEQCVELVSIPNGLFQYNTAANDFSATFNYCHKAVMPADIFIGSSSTPATRFASMNKVIYFGQFFSCVNTSVYPLSASGGTAPDLWNYTYGSAGYSLRSSTGYQIPPFWDHSNLTNWSVIPAGWK